jgi:hypothetical protein
MTKSRKMRWTGQEAITKDMRNFKAKDHFEDLGVGGRMLKCILKKQGMGMSNGFIYHRIRPSVRSCEDGDETSGCIKGEEEFID